MWFAFGFVSAFSFVVFLGALRYLSKWKGKSICVEDIWGQYKVNRNRGKLDKVLIGCSGEKYIDFTIRPERWWDKLAKSIGLSSEYKVGCEFFDKTYYLVSDHINLCYAFRTNKALKKLVEEIFAESTSRGYKLKAIHYRFSRVWLALAPSKADYQTNAESLANHLLPKLKLFSGTLFNSTSIRGPSLRDPFALKAAALLAISTGLAANGLFNMVRVDLFTTAIILDVPLIERYALFVGGGLALLLVLTALVILGRTARTHMVLIELMTIGLFGAWSSTYVALRDYNVGFDESEIYNYHSQILDKYASGGKSRSYYFVLQDWRPGGSTVKVRIPVTLYRALNEGQNVRIAQKAGALGIAWTETIFAL